MHNYLLLFLLFAPFILPAQLVLSTEIFQNGVSNALDVEAWGDRYIIRVYEQSVLPFDQVDYLFFADEDGYEYNSDPFNPYVRESSYTQTGFTVLTDSTALALATDSEIDGGGSPRLTRFNTDGDTLLTRDFPDYSMFAYSLCSSDSMIFFVGRSADDERETFTIRSLYSNFEDLYSLKFEDTLIADSRVTFNALHAEPDGTLYVVYERGREFPPFVDSEYFVATINANGLLVNKRSVGRPVEGRGFGMDYTAVLPVGEEGVAVLEGLDEPNSFCAGSACSSVGGNLLVYRDATSPAEVYKLNFSPFGMELLPDGELFVYGTTSFVSNTGHGVLFKPTGWPDGNRIHLIEDPFTAGQGSETYSRIYGMDVAENGDLVGTGEVGYNGAFNFQESSHWLFRIGPNGCFTADCSDLAEDPGDLVPVTDFDRGVLIKSFPNPFKDQLNFASTNQLDGQAITVSLRDLSGRLLRKGALGAGLQWPTDNLAPGVYLATFTSGSLSQTVKVVKW